jgi:transketolase
LSYDTGTHLARNQFPERYIQAGIAEQDMVSMAGTLALAGKTPIVHSFATFLTMRAAEQIFNNATEYSRVLYFGFLAGLVPSAPGFSHQAVSDVGLMASVPRMRLVEPSCASELESAIAWALGQPDPVYFRMGGLAPLEAVDVTPSPGGLVERVAGTKTAIVASGPLLAQEAVQALNILREEDGENPALYTMPWISEKLSDKAVKTLASFESVVVLENHNPAIAKHHFVTAQLLDTTTQVHRIGLNGIPANGQPAEVLAHHSLDAAALATALRALGSK